MNETIVMCLTILFNIPPDGRLSSSNPQLKRKVPIHICKGHYVIDLIKISMRMEPQYYNYI